MNWPQGEGLMRVADGMGRLRYGATADIEWLMRAREEILEAECIDLWKRAVFDEEARAGEWR